MRHLSIGTHLMLCLTKNTANIFLFVLSMYCTFSFLMFLSSEDGSLTHYYISGNTARIVYDEKILSKVKQAIVKLKKKKKKCLTCINNLQNKSNIIS